MKTNKKSPNSFENWKLKIKKGKKQLKRRTFLLKAKIFLTLILPVVIMILAAKTAQTWVHLKLKSMVLPSEKPKIIPVNLKKEKKEFVTPEPVKGRKT